MTRDPLNIFRIYNRTKLRPAIVFMSIDISQKSGVKIFRRRHILIWRSSRKGRKTEHFLGDHSQHYFRVINNSANDVQILTICMWMLRITKTAVEKCFMMYTNCQVT
jgi:hypothetical protein